MLGISRVMREVRAINDRAGLDFGSAAVLFTIAHHADGVRISDVADQIHLDLSTVSRHARALEGTGYLDKKPDPADGRATLVTTSDAGNDVLNAIIQHRTALFSAATADWDPDDTRALADLVDRLATRLNEQIHAMGATV